jgi:hypothetical protein
VEPASADRCAGIEGALLTREIKPAASRVPMKRGRSAPHQQHDNDHDQDDDEQSSTDIHDRGPSFIRGIEHACCEIIFSFVRPTQVGPFVPTREACGNRSSAPSVACKTARITGQYGPDKKDLWPLHRVRSCDDATRETRFASGAVRSQGGEP